MWPWSTAHDLLAGGCISQLVQLSSKRNRLTMPALVEVVGVALAIILHTIPAR